MNRDLLLQHFDRISEAPKAVSRLRQFILELAMRGKLVEQDPSDEPVSLLRSRIHTEKQHLATSRKIKLKPEASILAAEAEFVAPSGWIWLRLADVCKKIHYGYTASAVHSSDGIRLLRITDIQNNSVQWDSVPGCEISHEEAEPYLLEAGDILIARTGGTMGKTFLVGEVPVPCVFASYLIRAQPSMEVSARFLKRYCESPLYWKQLETGARGTGQPNVNGETLGNLRVPLPPLAEQNRITAKIGDLMVLCDQLEEAQNVSHRWRDRLTAASVQKLSNEVEGEELERHARFYINRLSSMTVHPHHIHYLREAILTLAVRGQLGVRDPNDEDAEKLLQRVGEVRRRLVSEGECKAETASGVLDEQAAPFPLPPCWQWARLIALCRSITKGSSPKWQGVNYVSESEGVLFITSENVGYYELRKMEAPKYVEKKFNAIEPRSILKRGDLLMTLVGASIGRTALYNLDAEANINQAVASIRLVEVEDGPDPRYLLHYFNSPVAIGLMLGSRVTTAQPNISLTDVREFPVPIPPRAEQLRIVARVDELMSRCDQLEGQIHKSSLISTQLLNSVLHRSLTPAISHVFDSGAMDRHLTSTMEAR